MPPSMCLCVQETLPTWSPLSPPQLQINIALLHCKSQWNLECQYPSSQSQMSFSAHLRLIFLELQIIEAGWEGHHHQVECNVNKFKLLWRGPFHKPSLDTGTLGHIMPCCHYRQQHIERVGCWHLGCVITAMLSAVITLNASPSRCQDTGTAGHCWYYFVFLIRGAGSGLDPGPNW